MLKVQCLLLTESITEVTVEGEGVEHALGPTVSGDGSTYIRKVRMRRKQTNQVVKAH